MGEVYRARDKKLDRDVAIKVLPERLAADPESLARFEREAKAVAALSHPNILSIFDFGRHQGISYAVMELLEGETLRSRLVGGEALPVRKAVDHAVQIARGLAAAHEKGIVHRDLKPENVFVTGDGRVKILDFGLARQAAASLEGDDTRSPTVTPGTEPGTVLGTVGYMSPEQVRGHAADARSDIFALGAVLYEMLSGRRAFSRETAAETMTTILKEEPPELAGSGVIVSTALDRVIRHCLEKGPQERFQSARDVAFALEEQSMISAPSASRVATSKRSLTVSALRSVAAVAGFFLLAVLASHVFWKTLPPQPRFHRLTFRPGTVASARFAPEGRTVVFSAAWEGKPVELFSTRMESSESRSLGYPPALLLGMSSASELAILVHPQGVLGGLGGNRGTLARVPLAGGAFHEILEDVVLADWTPDASELAVVRSVGGRNLVEWPIGRRLYETANNILAMRISPRGDRLALAEHAAGFGTNGSISVIDRDKKKTTVVQNAVGDFADVAWDSSGKEIWYEFGISGSDSLQAVDLTGRRRLLLRVPGRIQLFDLSSEGRALLNKVNWRVGILGVTPGQGRERDFSWLDVSEVDDVSPDGGELLIDEFGEGGDPRRWSVYLRKTDGSAAVRLGDGQAMALSPDGKSALCMLRTEPPQLIAYPTGPGEPKRIPNVKISDYSMAVWLPDGKRIAFSGVETGHGPRCYVQGVDGEGLRAVSPEGTILPTSQPRS
ncbi:MAG: serine/threonine protein kinase, partial [Thermoplasmata archaeon]|nr:serine/threonine protein kinase [Thermoplasmata archaeon]